MANCPKCSSEISEDFGLVTCPSCGASVFIDMDGNVSVSEEEAYVQEPIISQSNIEVEPNEMESELRSNSELFELPMDNDSVIPMPAPEQEFESEPTEEISEPTQDFFNEDSMGDESVEEQSVEEQSVEDESVEDESLEDESLEVAEVTLEEDYEEPSIGMPPPEEYDDSFLEEEHQEPASTDETMEEVAEFANSDVSAAEDGVYIYTLRLDGIDSGDVKNHILNTLSNPRLNLDAEGIVSTLKNGHLTIRDLNPAKAFVIVNEIKGLPIEIFWEQHDITS